MGWGDQPGWGGPGGPGGINDPGGEGGWGVGQGPESSFDWLNRFTQGWLDFSQYLPHKSGFLNQGGLGYGDQERYDLMRKHGKEDYARGRKDLAKDQRLARQRAYTDYEVVRSDVKTDRDADRQYSEDIYQQRRVESREDAANPVLVGGKLGGDHAAYMDAAYPGTNPWERLGVSNTGYSGGATGMIGNATTQASGDRTQMRVQQAQMQVELARAKMSTDAQVQSAQISAQAQIDSARISAGASGYVAETGADASRYSTDMQREIGMRQTEAQLRQAGVSEKQLRINERNLERIINRWPTEKKQMLAQAALAEQQTAHSQAMQEHDVRAKQYGMLAPAYAVYKELQKSDGFGQVMDVLLPVLGVGAAAKFATSQALRFGKKWAGKKPRNS